MAATDYEIVISEKSGIPYISKKNSRRRLSMDRRAITDDEFYMMVDAFMRRKYEESNIPTQTIMIDGKPIIEIVLLKN